MHLIVWSLYPYIPTCGWSLHFSCRAAEGVTKECTLQVLLLSEALDQMSCKFNIKIDLILSSDQDKAYTCYIYQDTSIAVP